MGGIKTWLDTVDCLEDWEKNLRLGDACLDTTAQSECARARFTIGQCSPLSLVKKCRVLLTPGLFAIKNQFRQRVISTYNV